MGYKELTARYEKDMGDIPWNIYPRPQMKRESFICLNGTWEFFLPGKKKGSIEKYEITVPFPPESRASGLLLKIPSQDIMVYSRKFTLEKPEKGKRVILHFGAVDRLCRVYVNNYAAGTHDGGYLPFSFDITDYLTRKSSENEIVVECEDPTDKDYPYGKQRRKRGGMWYTPISGIWQTVWMEIVPESYVKSIKITSNSKKVSFNIDGGAAEKHLFIKTPEKVLEFDFEGDEFSHEFNNGKCWSPKDPYLYEYTLTCGEDTLTGYFALREMGVKNGKITLNGKPIFLHALLDQGYYSDGIFLPSSPKGYEDDVLLAKSLGFNALRKHIKIEPLLFYHYCDVHGIIILQDCINNGKYSFFKDTALPTVGLKRLPLTHRTKKQRAEFTRTALEMSEHLASCPSVLYYTIFNEGWGQFKTGLYDIFKEKNPDKIIDTASGWFIGGKSDVHSHHVYFKRVNLKYKGDKPTILSEFGGYSLKTEGHTFGKKEYGYSKFKTTQALSDAIEHLYTDEIIPEIKKGLSGCVMTQLSDIEDEINGLITYDREVIKVDENRMRKISESLFKVFRKK